MLPSHMLYALVGYSRVPVRAWVRVHILCVRARVCGRVGGARVYVSWVGVLD